MSGHWRPSRRLRRMAPKVDRYWARCFKAAGATFGGVDPPNNAHVPSTHERRYTRFVSREYRRQLDEVWGGTP